MKIYINTFTGQQIMSENVPGEGWCCLGEAETNTMPNTTINPSAQYRDVNMTVGDDFDEDDI